LLILIIETLQNYLKMKNRIILLSLFIFLITGGVFGQISHQWSVRMGKNFSNVPERVIVDHNDDIILTGTSLSTSDLYSDILLTKYNSVGDSIWQYYIGKTGQSELVKGICVDDSNNIYIIGSIKGIVNLGSYNGTNNTVSAKGEYDLFVARFDPDGQIEWATSYGTSITEYGLDVIYNSENNLLMAVGNNHNTTTDKKQGLAITLVPYSGEITNTKMLSSTESLVMNQVESGDNGLFVVTGDYTGSFGGYPSEGLNDIFMGSINPESMQFNLISSTGNTDENVVIDLCKVNDYYIMSAENHETTTQRTFDYAIQIHDANLYYSGYFWQTSKPSSISSFNQYAYFAGSYTDEINIRGSTYISEGYNIFLGKYSYGKSILYVNSFPVKQGLFTDNKIRLANNSNGNLVMAGIFGDTLKFSGSENIVVSQNLADIFIAQFYVENSDAEIETISVNNIEDFTQNKQTPVLWNIHVPENTNLSNIKLELTLSENATIEPDPNTITDYRNQFIYTVTSEDRTTEIDYYINVIADLDIASSTQNPQENSIFEIYPNPANQTVSIKMPEYLNRQVTCTIRALDGRIVREQEIENNTSTIDISELQHGAYFIIIADEKQSLIGKFIKN
jgi:hypothetical protein